MDTQHETPPPSTHVWIGRLREVLSPLRLTVATVTLLALAVDPVAAQTAGSSFCDTEMANTIKNIFDIIQFGGPLIGGVIVLGAIISIPMIRQADRKREIKELRNQGFIWGLMVAPLGTEIVKFVLNNVVSGGISCGF